ncbi:PREDICTED: glycosyltransferase-like protein gnt13 [Polistes canadensis]|uniref:glycosyltransferase-like protein gnt13 n=1 Tax=Polistes canadensis TaxID=91411 RepID=UPI000718C023|nr:PREDICTED: glycosyltransferase-like protein gnt13 [Polistes canadensis]
MESLDNSTNIIKFDYAETSTEGLNSIDCSLSTFRTEILEETISQETQMETNSNNIIHLNDSDEMGNLNIKENQSMNLTTSRINPNEVKKDENIDDSFSTSVEKSEKLNVSLETTKNDKINNHNLAIIDETNKNDKSFDSSTFNDFNSTFILPVDLKKLTIVEIVNSMKSNDKKNPMESSVNNITNYEGNTRATISKILPILKNDNLTHPSNVATTNSMDYIDPSASSNIYDVFTEKTDSSIDRFHHKVEDKLKKLPVFREQPPGHVTKDHKANVELSSLVSKTITFLTDSITETNRFKEHPSNPLKRDRINNSDIEKNYRLFYNYGGGLPEKIRKYDRNILDFIRIKCKNECT